MITACIASKDLPSLLSRQDSQVLPINQDSVLVKGILPLTEEHPEQSGVYPLADGKDAFIARLALVDAAHDSLDLQYYIWHDDISGHLLFQHIYQAAQRGVRVRLLLDDNNGAGKDDLLMQLNAHKNIEVRLFNPFMQRKLRYLGFLTDFSRLNRRMHNKSLTVDGVTSIIGGRNIGDEYFNAGNGVVFADMDVAVIGAIVPEIAQDFDRYWNSQSSYPIDLIVNKPVDKPFPVQHELDGETQDYVQRLQKSDFAQKIAHQDISFIWADSTFVSDNPAKGLAQSKDTENVLAELVPIMQAAKKHLVIVSPYFVPTDKGCDLLESIAGRGVDVSVLTNSYAANDVGLVHSGYTKYRERLLKAGIKLYELKPEVTVRQKNDTFRKSGGASLHAKTFEIDDQQLFVGSFNMDPRSAQLNTELGAIFTVPELAQKMTQNLAAHSESVYKVSLTPAGHLQWSTVEAGQVIRFDTEPHTNLFKRTLLKIYGFLPIEWLL
ncbi:phospholipase D family protein [Brackiella oedipodis]|uniref:phospholipase D family protein n=1 Tax=Brackiella oedipodis TaxID=124225 RepID=UPI0006865A6C|nr:phospholipase D family protein [Brackiella oedipodis]